jgi:ribose transport system substrate-binding protein
MYMKKRLLAIILGVVMVASLVACGAKEEAPAEDAAVEEEAVVEEEAPAEEEAEAPAADLGDMYEVVAEAGTKADVNEYYMGYGVESYVDIQSMGGIVKWLGGNDVPMPTPNEKYVIGFADYATDDEVSAGYMDAMKEAAEEMGIEVLYNDAHWTQDEQNQAIEQWILQGVDGVILCPCDYYGVKDALDALEEAGIPTVSFDAPPLADTTHDAVVMYDAVEQGYLAGVALRDAILAAGKELSGTIYYGNLPYIHPNAQTREAGFKSAFEGDEVEFVMLTGETPEEFYSAMEGAIMADPDMLGAWGLFSAATWGMYQAIQASGEEILLSSVDCDTVILQGIKDGGILGSTCYAPTEGARLAAKVMVELLNGEEVPGITYQSNRFLDASNVEEMFEIYHPGKDPLQ